MLGVEEDQEDQPFRAEEDQQGGGGRFGKGEQFEERERKLTSRVDDARKVRVEVDGPSVISPRSAKVNFGGEVGCSSCALLNGALVKDVCRFEEHAVSEGLAKRL